MKVGNYRYVDRDLRLGDLKGNLFTLTLRGIEEGSQLSISEAVRTLRTVVSSTTLDYRDSVATRLARMWLVLPYCEVLGKRRLTSS